MLNSIFVKSFEKYFSMLSMLSIIYLNETFYINKYKKKSHTFKSGSYDSLKILGDLILDCNL